MQAIALTAARHYRAAAIAARMQLEARAVFALLESTDWRCADCGARAMILDLRYIFPVAVDRVGRHSVSNVRVCCAHCKRGKPEAGLVRPQARNIYTFPGQEVRAA